MPRHEAVFTLNWPKMAKYYILNLCRKNYLAGQKNLLDSLILQITTPKVTQRGAEPF